MNNALATETMQSLGSNVHVIVDCGNNYMWWWRWISKTAPTKPMTTSLPCAAYATGVAAAKILLPPKIGGLLIINW